MLVVKGPKRNEISSEGTRIQQRFDFSSCCSTCLWQGRKRSVNIIAVRICRPYGTCNVEWLGYILRRRSGRPGSRPWRVLRQILKRDCECIGVHTSQGGFVRHWSLVWIGQRVEELGWFGTACSHHMTFMSTTRAWDASDIFRRWAWILDKRKIFHDWLFDAGSGVALYTTTYPNSIKSSLTLLTLASWAKQVNRKPVSIKRLTSLPLIVRWRKRRQFTGCSGRREMSILTAFRCCSGVASENLRTIAWINWAIASYTDESSRLNWMTTCAISSTKFVTKSVFVTKVSGTADKRSWQSLSILQISMTNTPPS